MTLKLVLRAAGRSKNSSLLLPALVSTSLFLASACGSGRTAATPAQPTIGESTGASEQTPAVGTGRSSPSITGNATGRPSATVVAVAGTPGLITLTPAGAKPDTLSIQADRPVTWQNDDTRRHHIISDEPGLFDTGDIAPGSSATATLTVTGVHDWHDTLTSLTGTIRVLK